MKRILFTALLILSAIGIYAVPADPTPGIFVQPNGDTITIYLRGDEYAHWYNTPSTQLDLTGLAPDTYILRIIINESIVSTTQVIVQ